MNTEYSLSRKDALVITVLMASWIVPTLAVCVILSLI